MYVYLLLSVFLFPASCSPVLFPRSSLRSPIQRSKHENVKIMPMPNGVSVSAGKKKIIVLGGDGFCGWPTSLHLSDAGHEIIIVDNLSRRKIDAELGTQSLTPIKPIEERCSVWNSLSNRVPMRFVYLDVQKDYNGLLQLLKEECPDVIVHFAEQRAAPYSMKNGISKRYTVNNNIGGTHNILTAIVEAELEDKVHLVHLGTMGVYGYTSAGAEIPEGYVDVEYADGRKQSILHPAYPGSVYHMTKCMDATMFQYYNKNDHLRISDLHQGIVWGTHTNQTLRDERLINRFDYDGDYGTVLNRFLMQSAMGLPLTVYGTGEQTRAFIHISDTVKCVELAIDNPPGCSAPVTSADASNSNGTFSAAPNPYPNPNPSQVHIYNQVAETRRLIDIARTISDWTKCGIQYLSNPRVEDITNELHVCACVQFH